MNKKYLIMIVGVGGTGGHFATSFSKFLANSSKKSDYTILLIDGDVVEAKNCDRQQFITEDIGRYKAEVLQELISQTYNLNVFSHNSFLTNSNELEKILYHYNRFGDTMPILIGSVDNHAARKVMHEFFNITPNILYLDSANEFSVGEVVLSFKEYNKLVSPPRAFYFPDILDEEHRDVTEMSCEELNASEPQHLTTNIMAANILLTATVDYISNNKKPRGIVLFDAFEYVVRRREFEQFSK